MDHRLPNWINNYLSPDEYVVWNGKPGTGNLLSKQDIYMIPFSIIWLSFAILWESRALITSAPFLFKIWGIPFICVGLYMVVGRFIMKSYLRKETIYVITNKRIFAFVKNQVNTIDYHLYPTKTITRYSDGFGTICFSSSAQPNMVFYMPNQFSDQTCFVLDNIPNADHVLQILSNPW